MKNGILLVFGILFVAVFSVLILRDLYTFSYPELASSGHYLAIKLRFIREDIYKASLWYLEKVCKLEIIKVEVEGDRLTLTVHSNECYDLNSIARMFTLKLYKHYEFNTYTFIVMECINGTYNVTQSGWIDKEQLEKVKYSKVDTKAFGELIESFDMFL